MTLPLALPPLPHRIFFFGLLLTALVMASPPLALVLGLLVGILAGHPFPKSNGPLIKKLMQASIVGLGFGMNLHQVIQAGRTGIALTILSIAITLLAGFLLGKALRLQPKTSHLIACGTAICGGSAIAAVGPVLNADEREMSVSLGTIFILNAIALLIFPPIGHWLHLSQAQFGLWSGIAIHDTSSVVGAAAKYGNAALSVATTVKLSRALWIVPLVFLTAFCFRTAASADEGAKTAAPSAPVPWFILFFLLASVVQTFVPSVAALGPTLVSLSKLGMTLTLFLIGAGLSMKALRSVGVKPLILGVALWILIGALSLGAVLGVSGP